MTYTIGIRCDICGEVCTEEHTGQEHKVPEGWASFSMHYPGGLGQQRHACPRCTNAIGNGKLPVQEYLESLVKFGEPCVYNPTQCNVTLGQLDSMTVKKSEDGQEYKYGQSQP